MKIGLLYREKIVNKISADLERHRNLMFFDFYKVPAFSLNKLRNDLRKINAAAFVTKNTIFHRVLSASGLNGEDLLDQTTGIVFTDDANVVNVSKMLSGFSAENEGFKIKGGFLNGSKVDSKGIDALSKLPPRDVLLGMAVRSLAAPLAGFLSAANQVILKFVWTVEEIKKKK